MKIQFGVLLCSLSLAWCAPAPAGNDASADVQSPRDSGVVMDASVGPDAATMVPDIVGTWVYTSGANEQRLNFRGDGRYEVIAQFTSSGSGCVSATNYSGMYTLTGDVLMGTASSASAETTDCNDPAMNRAAQDVTDAMAIARGDLSGTVMISGDRLTLRYDASGTETTREYQRAM